MPYQLLLNIVRICCIGQFVIVILLTFPGGFSQIEIGAVAMSIAFGLIVSGFTRNILHTTALEAKKKELDAVMNDLMKKAENEQRQAEEDIV